MTAPLSSRRFLCSVMDKNKPPGYPQLEPGIRRALIPHDDPPSQNLSDQGLELVHSGPALRVYRSGPSWKPPDSRFFWNVREP